MEISEEVLLKRRIDELQEENAKLKADLKDAQSKAIYHCDGCGSFSAIDLSGPAEDGCANCGAGEENIRLVKNPGYELMELHSLRKDAIKTLSWISDTVSERARHRKWDHYDQMRQATKLVHKAFPDCEELSIVWENDTAYKPATVVVQDGSWKIFSTEGPSLMDCANEVISFASGWNAGRILREGRNG